MANLSKDQMVAALARLGVIASEQAILVELVVVGGAAMVLAWDARPSTRDIDVLIQSPAEAETVRALARVAPPSSNSWQ